MTVTTTVLSDQLDAVIEEETDAFVARQPESRAFRDRARRLAGGATSNWQIAEPQAVWISHGSGSKIYDVDGFEYSDFHGGYGVSLAGHAHPAIVAAVQERVTRGTHFAQPTEDAIVVADNLAERFDQPLWRFGNSGTEATMDAVHLMRAATGRDRILKVEGCYHGHHDSVVVSVLPEADDDIGPADRPHNVPDNSGIPNAIMDLVTVVPFNDLGGRRAGAGRASRRGRRDDPRADDDERRHHPPRRRLPRRAQGPAAPARRAAHLRRGEDRPDRRPRRRHPDVRRDPRPGLPGEGDGRRHLDGGDRRQRGGDVDDRRRPLRAGRHVQRQPARDGLGPGDADRGAHARGVRAPRPAARPDGARPPGRHRPARPALARRDRRRQGLRLVPAATRSATSATSSSSTGATARRTGWCSTTAARSCRRGARSSSG